MDGFILTVPSSITDVVVNFFAEITVFESLGDIQQDIIH